MLLCLPLFVRVVDSSLRELRLFMQTLRKPPEHILETAGAVRAGDCTTAAASGAVRALAMYAFSKVDMSVKGMPNTGGDFEGRHKPGYHQDFRSKKELRPGCKHVCKLSNMWWTCQSRADTWCSRRQADGKQSLKSWSG